MIIGEIVVHLGNYNFTKFHQNQMKNIFINSPFFCSKFQSVSRIVKIVHSAIVIRILGEDFFIVGKRKFTLKMMCTICQQKWKVLQSFRQQFQTERFIIHGWIGVVQKLYIFLERLLHSCSSSVCVWNFEIVCKKNEKKSRKLGEKKM